LKPLSKATVTFEEDHKSFFSALNYSTTAAKKPREFFEYEDSSEAKRTPTLKQ
jgi:hypothetical protein